MASVRYATKISSFARMSTRLIKLELPLELKTCQLGGDILPGNKPDRPSFVTDAAFIFKMGAFLGHLQLLTAIKLEYRKYNICVFAAS